MGEGEEPEMLSRSAAGVQRGTSSVLLHEVLGVDRTTLLHLSNESVGGALSILHVVEQQELAGHDGQVLLGAL
jgi:hypothetical protein